MTTFGTAFLLVCVLVPLALLIAVIGRQRWLAREMWFVECPDTESFVGVRLSEEPLTTARLLGRGDHPHVTECEHWPAKYGCAQTCVHRQPSQVG